MIEKSFSYMLKKKLPTLLRWTCIGFFALLMVTLLFFQSWITEHIPAVASFNTFLSKLSLNYFRFFGTDRTFSYLYILLLLNIIYQWSAHKHISYKPLFVVLSLSVTLTIVYCFSTFFAKYVPHIAILANNKEILLLNDPKTAFPSGHIARLVALVTCLCIIFPKRKVWIVLITFTTFELLGISILFDNRYFISGLLFAVLLGIAVPFYIKKLIFVQRLFNFQTEIRASFPKK